MYCYLRLTGPTVPVLVRHAVSIDATHPFYRIRYYYSFDASFHRRRHAIPLMVPGPRTEVVEGLWSHVTPAAAQAATPEAGRQDHSEAHRNQGHALKATFSRTLPCSMASVASSFDPAAHVSASASGGIDCLAPRSSKPFLAAWPPLPRPWPSSSSFSSETSP
jgi:hypothetical protein